MGILEPFRDEHTGRATAPANVTPVVLTSDEEANIGRTLEALSWAGRVVVLDSGSTDRTEQIVRSYPNTVWLTRPFDCHRDQWQYAIHHPAVSTDYVLALDADMVVSPRFLEELQQSFFPGGYAGATMPFDFVVGGRRLAGSIYPPQLRLFFRSQVEVIQHGHSQEFVTSGPVYRFHSRIVHDDRKALDRWLTSQLRYSVLEAERVRSGPGKGLRDSLRRCGLMPLVSGVLAYIRSGGPLSGKAAVRYALERSTFECILPLRLHDTSQAPDMREQAADIASGRTAP